MDRKTSLNIQTSRLFTPSSEMQHDFLSFIKQKYESDWWIEAKVETRTMWERACCSVEFYSVRSYLIKIRFVRTRRFFCHFSSSWLTSTVTPANKLWNKHRSSCWECKKVVTFCRTVYFFDVVTRIWNQTSGLNRRNSKWSQFQINFPNNNIQLNSTFMVFNADTIQKK